MTSTSDPTPSCLIADDHHAVREGVRMRLEQHAIARVVGEAPTAEVAMQLIDLHRPAIALVDLQLPIAGGMSVLAHVAAHRPATRTVVYSATTSLAAIERCFEEGAHGYVSKDASTSVLGDAIDAALKDTRYIDPTLAPLLLDPETSLLSDRELTVLELMAAGCANKAIALELELTEETVKSHVSSIMRKLEASNRTGAVVTAIRRSLLRL